MKKLILSLIVVASTVGSVKINAMDSNIAYDLEKSKQHVKHMKRVIEDLENGAQLFDIAFTTGLVAGFVATAGGNAIPASLAILITTTGLGSVLTKLVIQANKFSGSLTKAHIWDIKHNKIQS